ncbi:MULTISPECIES: hypothetical protein [unclassified Pseudoxanthomonas]|uniref:hypothetical protein n=1 Tax=unclassified Pseudoxanthomonas TaxID=2645906 RepID=UPI001113FA34|nr:MULTISPECIES: hypothetical protein [unclassified Pseudoxanthomonas]
MKKIHAFEGVYRLLVQEACSRVPGDAGKIWARSEIFDGVSTTGLYYLSRRNEHRAVYDGIDKLDARFNALHGEFIASGAPPFTAAILSIERTRRFFRDNVSFSVSYSYEDVSDMAFERRTELWLKDIFGRDPDLQFD